MTTRTPTNQEVAASAIPVWAAPAPAGVVSLTRIIGDDAVLVKTGPGTLVSITFNSLVADDIVEVRDALDANTGTILADFKLVAGNPFTLQLGWAFAVGLFVSVNSTSEITVAVV